MIKFIDYDGLDEYGSHIELLHPNVLIKTAEYSPELAEFVQNLKPEEGKTYVLINAMGSGEHYGANRNGDYFPEKSLTTYHKTFEKLGHAYKHHINKDPERSYGKVKFSHYNPGMHRVELIVELDRSKTDIEDIIKRLEKGEYPATSMGVRLPYDECSICGHKSKTVKDYCNHLKYEMGRVYPDGRKVSAINREDLKFFDISFVRIPADKTSGVMAKIASAPAAATASAQIGEDVLKRAGIKEADLIKEIEGEVKMVNNDPRGLIYSSQMEMPIDELRNLLGHYSLAELLSTLLGLHIMPTKVDFQRMYALAVKHPQTDAICAAKHPLFSIDGGTLVDKLPDDIGLDNFSDAIAQKIAHWIPQMSLTKPLLIKRAFVKMAMDIPNPISFINVGGKQKNETLADVKIIPTSGQHNPVFALAGLSALYLGYNKLMDGSKVPLELAQNQSFQKWLLSRPWILPALIGVASAATAGGQAFLRHQMLEKNSAVKDLMPKLGPDFLKRMFIAVPPTYLYAGYQENKLRQGKQVSEVGDIVRKHPFMASLAGTYGLYKVPQLASKFVKAAELDVDKILVGLTPEKLEEVYQDVIGAPTS